MSRLLARIWRGLRGPAQWWIFWAAHAQFIAGITGLVRNDAGHVLLLRHRLWPPQHQWGLPTGYAKRRETFEATIIREVKEETGLAVAVGPLVQLTSGYQLRIEVAYAATLRGTAETKRKISHRLAKLRAAPRLHDDHPDVTSAACPMCSYHR